MSTLSARSKAMRGTKRTCQACEVRFYDLARSPIVCPSCGDTLHTPGGTGRASKRASCVILQQDRMAPSGIEAGSTDTAS